MKQIVLSLFLTSSLIVSAQQEKDPIKYFSKVKNYREFAQLAYNSLPDSNDYHSVFTDTAVKLLRRFYSLHFSYAMPDTNIAEYKKPVQVFEEAHLGETRTAAQLINEPKFYTRVSNGWLRENVFKSTGTVFYYIVYSDTQKYISFSYYWTYVNGKWVFFSMFYKGL